MLMGITLALHRPTRPYDRYVDSNYPGCTLETLPDSAVVALAKSHLIDIRYLTSDFSTGYLQESNMYDRKVQVTIEKRVRC